MQVVDRACQSVCGMGVQCGIQHGTCVPVHLGCRHSRSTSTGAGVAEVTAYLNGCNLPKVSTVWL